MTINQLHNLAVCGGEGAEERLFQSLSESFRLFVQQRIWNRQDAEEIVQDALATIAGKYRGIDFETSFAAWAYKTLENKILHYYRTKRCRESKFSQISNGDLQSTPVSIDPVIKRRLLDCFKKISEVNNRYARILNLRYQGYSTEEVCTRLNATRNTVYILLTRARSMLKFCLEHGEID